MSTFLAITFAGNKGFGPPVSDPTPSGYSQHPKKHPAPLKVQALNPSHFQGHRFHYLPHSHLPDLCITPPLPPLLLSCYLAPPLLPSISR